MDLQSLLGQVSQWSRDSQHEPVVQILEILIESSSPLTKFEQTIITPTKESATQNTKALLYTYFGESLFKLKYFRRALRAYEAALSFNETGSRRASKRSKSNTNSGSLNSNCDINKIFSNSINCNENELKLRIHFCHLALHEMKEARSILEKIPPVERNIKILVALADLYCQEKNVDQAKEMYLEIIRQDPMRLDFVTKLCRLGGCEANTILDLIPDDIKKGCTWYPSWIQAQCYLHSPRSKQAIRLFETLTSRFERKAAILTSLAEAYYHDGNFKEAIRIFQIAYNNDPLILSGVGSYAACLHKEASKQTLEDLAISMSAKCSIEGEYFHEPWLVLGHYYADTDKQRALYFVQKAYKLSRYSVEALILLACLYLEKKESARAIPYIMTAQTQAPYRYEVQRILCNSFLANNKKSAALSYAKVANQTLGETARSHFLWADILLKMQDQKRKIMAKNLLVIAIKLDRSYLPAVFAYCDLLMEDKKFDKAIDILTDAQPHHSSNGEIHKYLYKCYSEKKESDKALYHQNLSSEQIIDFHDEVCDNNHRTPTTTTSAPNNCTPANPMIDPLLMHDDVDQMLAIGLEADELVDVDYTEDSNLGSHLHD